MFHSDGYACEGNDDYECRHHLAVPSYIVLATNGLDHWGHVLLWDVLCYVHVSKGNG